jgi:hypothetical protein
MLRATDVCCVHKATEDSEWNDCLQISSNGSLEIEFGHIPKLVERKIKRKNIENIQFDAEIRGE